MASSCPSPKPTGGEQEDGVLLAREVCGLLRCGRSKVYQLFQTGQLEGFRVGDGVRFLRSGVNRYKAAQANAVSKPCPPTTLMPKPVKHPRRMSPALHSPLIGGYGHGL